MKEFDNGEKVLTFFSLETQLVIFDPFAASVSPEDIVHHHKLRR